MRETGNELTGTSLEVDATATGSAYADLILVRMAEKGVSLRSLSTRCRIGKSRLGSLLHRNPLRRAAPSLSEYRAIIGSLDLSIFEAVICAEVIGREQWCVRRYAPAIAMLSRLFRDLPAGMIAALAELDEMDGTEVRPEWSVALERAVVKRVVQEIGAIAARRAALDDLLF